MTNPDGTRTLQVRKDLEDERSGWYTASLIGVFFFTPLAIVGGLIDNSICRTRGLPPKYGAMVAGSIFSVIGLIVVVTIMTSQNNAACLAIANDIVAESTIEEKGPPIEKIEGISRIAGVGDVRCTGLATYESGGQSRITFYQVADYFYWE